MPEQLRLPGYLQKGDITRQYVIITPSYIEDDHLVRNVVKRKFVCIPI